TTTSGTETMNATKHSNRLRRIHEGGIYLWRPTKWRKREPFPCTFGKPNTGNPWLQSFIAFLVVAVGEVTGSIISWRVPPVGVTCRHPAQLSMFLSWGASYLLTFLFERAGVRHIFWVTFLKDAISTAISISLLLTFHAGGKLNHP